MNNKYNVVFKNRNEEKEKVDWIEKNNEDKAKAYSDMEEMTNAIKNSPEMFKRYLDLQSKFDRYSAGNCLIVLKNCPNATQFKEKDEWKKEGVLVNQNAKGFTYLKAHTKDDYTYFNAKTAYDISETDAIVEEKIYNYNWNKLLSAFLENCPAKVESVDEIDEGKLAEYDKVNNILYISKSVDNEVDFFNQVAQQLGIIEMKAEIPSDYKDFKSYCISYMICKKYGIDTSSYNFDTLPPEIVNQRSTQSIREELSKIRNSYEKINSRIVDYLQKSNREKENNINEER